MLAETRVEKHDHERLDKTMTTIDHQKAATVAAAKALFVMQHRVAVEKFELNSYAALSEAATREASNALTAAAPHLRAAWEREMVEKIRAKFLGPDFGRNPVNGQDSPDAALHAAYDEGLQTALALLEGGGE
jgi:hypothetical protein